MNTINLFHKQANIFTSVVLSYKGEAISSSNPFPLVCSNLMSMRQSRAGVKEAG